MQMDLMFPITEMDRIEMCLLAEERVREEQRTRGILIYNTCMQMLYLSRNFQHIHLHLATR